MTQTKAQPTKSAANIQDLENLYETSPLSSGEPVPISVASFLLGLPAAAIKQQVKEGSRRGFRAKTKKGKKWFLDPAEIADCQNTTLESDSISSVVILENNVSRPPSKPAASRAGSDKQIEMIRELQAKLEALTFRNGYLEAQLSESERQIKLLADSQKEPTQGGWNRFWRWMLGMQK